MMSMIACGVTLSISRARGDLTIDAACVQQPPQGVRIGQAVAVVQVGASDRKTSHNR